MVVEHAFEIECIILARIVALKLCNGVVVVHDVYYPVVNDGDFFIVGHIVGNVRRENVACFVVKFFECDSALIVRKNRLLPARYGAIEFV